MKILRPSSAPDSRGAALMLALLVLFVLVAVAFQIRITTDTDARVGRNQIGLTRIELSIESALIQLFDQLAMDAEAGAGGGAGGDAGGMGLGGGMDSMAMDPFGMAGMGGGDPAAGAMGGGAATDSKNDDWARPQRSEINGVRLRILVQDEESKLNVLSMLTEDEEEAEKAFRRVARVLEFCRKGTAYEIDTGQAYEMAEQMRDYMLYRSEQFLPRPELLTDAEDGGSSMGGMDEAIGLPLTLREFILLPAFEEDQFRDFVDEDGGVVHSIESFLTIWTGLSTAAALPEEATLGAGGTDPPADPAGGVQDPAGAGSGGGSGGGSGAGPSLNTAVAGMGAGGPGGGDEGGEADGGLPGGGGVSSAASSPLGVAVNINTAPNAVLHGLMDDRDVEMRFWDEIVEYRNLLEEDEELGGLGDALEEEEALLDEWGEPVEDKKIFEDLEELVEIYGWENLEPVVQAEVRNLLTVESHVFSVYVTGRILTGSEDSELAMLDPSEVERIEREGNALTRTVRCVIWRRPGDDGSVEILPLIRWEPIDYVPWEVQDFPDEERTRYIVQ